MRLLLFAAWCTFLLWAPLSYAEIVFNNLSNDVDVSHCKEYFRYEWNSPLDMRDAAHGALYDVPQNMSREIDSFSYSDGLLSFTTTGNSAPVTLLAFTPEDMVYNVPGALPIGSRYGEVRPVDSSEYRYLVVRMSVSQDTWAQVLWSTSNEYLGITAFHVPKGWGTYRVDLSQASVGAGHKSWLEADWTALQLYPANADGVHVEIDWIQLQSNESCGSFGISAVLTPPAGSFTTLVLDEDLDPANGISQSYLLSTSGETTWTLNATTSMPGTAYRVYGFHSGDWATNTFFDPFDFENSSDYLPNTVGEIENIGISAGKLVGTTTGGDPNFHLNLRQGYTIDAADYRYLSMRLELPQDLVARTLQFWFTRSGSTPQFVAIPVNGGDNLIQLELTAGHGWTGQIEALRIDPVDLGGVQFALDFVAITADGFVGSLGKPELMPAEGSVSFTPLEIAFDQPDKKGGAEFAQNQIGRAWNMGEAGDIATITNVLYAEYLPHNTLLDPSGTAQTGSFFRAFNITGNGDPQYPSLLFDSENCIDTTEWVNLCYRGWNSTESNNFNSVARIIWHDAALNLDGYRDGDDIVMNRGAAEYCVDLRTFREAQLEPPVPDGDPNPWTSISEAGSCVDLLRVDMNESTEEGHHSVIDYIHLRRDHHAREQFAVVVNAPIDQEVSVFYTSIRGTADGTPIGVLPAGRDTNVLLWNTSAVTDGTYYIYGVSAKNGNTLSRAAEGRIIVDSTVTQDQQAPLLECERPIAGTSFGDSLEVAGYAMDETRLAALELLIDGRYLRTIRPNMFHLAARDSRPTWAEANHPGFHEFIDASDLADGSYMVTLRAVDTGGNEAICAIPVAKDSLASALPPIEYPAAEATPIPMASINQGTNPQITRARVTKKGVFVANISSAIENDVAQCNLKLSVGADADSAVTEVETFAVTSSNVRLRASKMNIRRAKLPRFFVNIEKDCAGYNPKTVEGGAARVAVRSQRGRIHTISAVANRLSKQTKAVMLR